jgi:hypothetical protein
MTAYKKDQVKELLAGSITAKVDIQVQQLCENLKGVLEFQVKIAGAPKVSGNTSFSMITQRKRLDMKQSQTKVS